MLPDTILNEIEEKVFEVIIKQTIVTGGDSNICFRLDSKSGERFFVKWNPNAPQDLYKTEANGLKLLASANTEIHLPTVYLVKENYIVMEFIDEFKEGSSYLFGSELAHLHHKSNELFGLNESNYIGILPQSNRYQANWLEFFIRERLEPQVKMAIDSGKLPSSLHSIFERTFNYTYVVFPDEPPALLHGDLWKGNYMWNAFGNAIIFDPAVYYGHREMDLAMTHLFGGFSDEFYQGYQDVYPLEKGYEERFKLCNLYPILVHANLFGGGYVNQAKSLLKQFF